MGELVTAPTRLTPGSRAYLTAEKSAHVIREVEDGFALPWCEAIEGIALFADVDDGPESPRIAPVGMPVCVGCRRAMAPAVDAGSSPGQLVREERLERGWPQAELAARLGWTTGMVSHLERDQKAVSKPVAHALAKVLGIPAREWLKLQKLANPDRARRVA